jgi:hypothetical protein
MTLYVILWWLKICENFYIYFNFEYLDNLFLCVEADNLEKSIC